MALGWMELEMKVWLKTKTKNKKKHTNEMYQNDI